MDLHEKLAMVLDNPSVETIKYAWHNDPTEQRWTADVAVQREDKSVTYVLMRRPSLDELLDAILDKLARAKNGDYRG